MGKNLGEGSVLPYAHLISLRDLILYIMIYCFISLCSMVSVIPVCSGFLLICQKEVNKSKLALTELPVTIFYFSILGLLLFIIYVNGFSSLFTDCHCVMYADDTTLQCCASTVDEVQIKLQNSINLCS